MRPRLARCCGPRGTYWVAGCLWSWPRSLKDSQGRQDSPGTSGAVREALGPAAAAPRPGAAPMGAGKGGQPCLPIPPGGRRRRLFLKSHRPPACLTSRRSLVTSWVLTAEDGVACHPSSAGFILYLKFQLPNGAFEAPSCPAPSGPPPRAYRLPLTPPPCSPLCLPKMQPAPFQHLPPQLITRHPDFRGAT